MVKRCQWGLCNSDSRYPERLEGGIKFIPFPKPRRSKDKCLRWIKLCGRPHDQLNESIVDGNRHLFVCAKKMESHIGKLKEIGSELKRKSYQLKGCFSGIRIPQQEASFLSQTANEILQISNTVLSKACSMAKFQEQAASVNRKKLSSLKKENFELRQKVTSLEAFDKELSELDDSFLQSSSQSTADTTLEDPSGSQPMSQEKPPTKKAKMEDNGVKEKKLREDESLLALTDAELDDSLLQSSPQCTADITLEDPSGSQPTSREEPPTKQANKEDDDMKEKKLCDDDSLLALTDAEAVTAKIESEDRGSKLPTKKLNKNNKKKNEK